MKYIVWMLIPLLLSAEPLTTLFKRVEQSDLYKSKSEAIDAELAQKRASLYSDGWRVGSDIGFADVKDGSDQGVEYALTVGKDFMLNGSKIETLLKQAHLYSDMRKAIEKNRLKVRLWRLYGNYCITQQALQAKEELATIYHQMSQYIDKGVRFGEFDAGKAIMAHLTLENLTLQISDLKSQQENLKAQINAIVPFDGHFTCHALRPDFLKLFNPDYSALLPLLQRGVQTSKEMVELSQNKTPSLGIDTTYSNELDTRRYMLSLSLPLAFGTNNEAQRVAALHSYAAARYELQAFRRQYLADTQALKKRLRIYTDHVAKSEDSIRLSLNTLIEQSHMRFMAGEESFIAMLKAAETKLQMIETVIDLKTKRHTAVSNYLYNYAIDPESILIKTCHAKKLP